MRRFVTVVLVILTFACVASAQRAWVRSRAQGILLARIIVNEQSRVIRPNGGADLDELSWFASAVVNNRERYGKSVHGWLDVLGKLAPHVARLRPISRPRQEWTSTLTGCTEAQPSGWVPERDGDWEIYALNWQSFCLDVRDSWVNDTFTHYPDVNTWGNLADTQNQLCRPRRHGALCLMQRFEGGNFFLGPAGSASCNYTMQEEFVEAHCEGRRR